MAQQAVMRERMFGCSVRALELRATISIRLTILIDYLDRLSRSTISIDHLDGAEGGRLRGSYFSGCYLSSDAWEIIRYRTVIL